MPADRSGLDFLVDRAELRRVGVEQVDLPSPEDLAEGEVLLRVDEFAFTANNVTYGVFGDAMSYWKFFPAREGKGRIPVWGFADVAAAAHEQLSEGERVFGYLPMSTHLVVRPDRVSERGFVDAAPHRAELPGAYQQYARTAGDPGYDPDHEDELAIFRPLFLTSFLIEAFLSDERLFGARQVVLSSASSKTALGTAFLLSQHRPGDCEVIGVTSPRNVGFCRETGYYDRAVPYGELDSIASDVPTVLLDMAGGGEVLSALHHHFGESLTHSSIVGATHWEERSAGGTLPGPQPEFFFAPTHLARRSEGGELGGVEGYPEAWRAFMGSVHGWLEVVHSRGPEAVEAVYREVLEGESDPRRAHMLSLAPA